MSFRASKADTHPDYLRSSLVRLWLQLSGFKSIRSAAKVLRVKQPSISRWLTTENEPSRLHLAVMAGYVAEGQNGLLWGNRPVSNMLGYAASVSGVAPDRIRRLTLIRGHGESVDKQAAWRLFEVALAVSLEYSLHVVEMIDWHKREVIQTERPAMRRDRRGIWLPSNFLALACPAPVAPSSQPIEYGAPPPAEPGGRRRFDINALWGRQ